MAIVQSISKSPLWLRLGLIFPLIFLNGWLVLVLMNYLNPLGSILITAGLLAFLLDFPIRSLQERGIPRGLATGIVLVLALLLLSLLALILIPLIVQQLSELITILPKWIESGSQQIKDFQQWAIAQKLSVNLGDIVTQNISDILTQAAEKVSKLLQSLSSQLLNFVLTTITSIVNILVVLVLTVFLVFTGESVWDGIFSWFPAPWDVRLRDSLQTTFETYFASQAILAGILSAAQTLVFLLLGVPYAVLFGVAIGTTTLIPYASALTIISISLLLALQNVTLGLKVLLAAIVVGQINDQIVAPRLLGGMTGLNPVWLIVALFIGGKLGGILGLLIAVPLASVIKSTTDDLRGFSEEALEDSKLTVQN